MTQIQTRRPLNSTATLQRQWQSSRSSSSSSSGIEEAQPRGQLCPTHLYTAAACSSAPRRRRECRTTHMAPAATSQSSPPGRSRLHCSARICTTRTRALSHALLLTKRPASKPSGWGLQPDPLPGALKVPNSWHVCPLAPWIPRYRRGLCFCINTHVRATLVTVLCTEPPVGTRMAQVL